jgi:hypothetical protein
VRTLSFLPVALAAIAVSGALASTATARTTVPPKVPAELQPPAGAQLFDVGHALGVQVYSCNGTAWTFVEPKAVLVTDRLQFIHHFAGPTWQHQDGSSVVGQLAKPPVTVDPKAIPWLLLSAKSTTAGKFGNRLTKTTFIQRLNTRGGLAPAASTCTAATAGSQKQVPYTADYFFWRGGVA